MALPHGLPHTDPESRVISALADLVGIYRNSTSWYNNASFLLPLLATLLIGLLAALTHHAELLGFAAFLAVVTLIMLPVVLLTWRQTATTVVLTESGILSLHSGRVLQSLNWRQVHAIQRRETQGNVRWEVLAANGERILLDGEIEHLVELVGDALRLSGLDARPMGEQPLVTGEN